MELKKIYFDAFKSLLNKELIITETCLGFVGINESGKSNLLEAINVLGGERRLRLTDTPKMAREFNPKIRFEFELTAAERGKIIKAVQAWAEKYSLVGKAIKSSTFRIIYNVEYNKTKDLEERCYSLSEYNLDKNCLVLKGGKEHKEYKIRNGNNFIPLTEAIIIPKTAIQKNEEYLSNCIALGKLNEQINNLNNEIKEILEAQKEEATEETVPPAEVAENVETQEPAEETVTKELPEVTNKKERLEKHNEEKVALEAKVGEYDLHALIGVNKEHLEDATNDIDISEIELKTAKTKIAELERVEERTTEQNSELKENQGKVKAASKALIALREKLKKHDELISVFTEPLREKYTDESTELNNYISEDTNVILNKLCPKVVYWEHSDDYILESNTTFTEILEQKSLGDLSRPLVNVFRICLGIETFEELKDKIGEIQKDESERSRLYDTFNRAIKKYLKEVWPDYDQQIRITLEEHKIRIEFYDPECVGASFYSMAERSQGCQTFISFLLTIGAEAKRGVITNTILLLDEPETHLHPSGVKFMLEELIKIAEQGNTVLFATHSIFMIDRDNYHRHIILRKEKEYTQIQPSTQDRIGFFMQEEVLYGALDINLSKDFKSTNLFNFVFEGEGDAILFKHFYESVLSNKERPFSAKNTSFYHGGGCTRITNYFVNTPIQLRTKWVITLDKDVPANKLKNMLEGRYKEYINKDVFVFQYEKEKLKELELEDILPQKTILSTYKETDDFFGVGVDQEKIKKLVNEDASFIEYNDNILDTHYTNQKEDFKAKFKELLNKNIGEALKEAKDKASFEKAFPEYEKWVRGMIASINNSK